MEQVGANRMSPAHVTPLRAERIELIEQVVFAFVIDETIWIIRPILRRREMVLKTPWPVICARRRICCFQNCWNRQNQREPSRHSISLRKAQRLLEAPCGRSARPARDKCAHSVREFCN